MLIPMKKLLAIIVLSLCFIAPSQADDIRDFQIEGMSIGDSLLNYLSEKEIKKTINKYPKKGFIYKSKDYYALTFNSEMLNLKNYYNVQFHLKNKDKNYIIHSISGIDKIDINKCYAQINTIEKEIEILFKNLKKTKKKTQKHPYDKTGESSIVSIYYYLDDGSNVGIVCTDWSDSVLKINKGWFDHLRLKMSSSEFINWMKNKAYK
jgi:hypothetical protein